MPKTTLILGASPKPHRYAHIAARMLEEYGHPIIEVGRTESTIPVKEVDTITMYLNNRNQEMYEDQVLELKPKRVIFNPGAENPRLEGRLLENGIEAVNACTLVMLRTDQY